MARLPGFAGDERHERSQIVAQRERHTSDFRLQISDFRPLR